jgi:tRNA (guanine-N7-)-methyltransferase
LFIATDWKDYADHIMEVCDSDNRLTNLAGNGHAAPRPYWRKYTRFEQRGLKLKHEVWDFVYALK